MGCLTLHFRNLRGYGTERAEVEEREIRGELFGNGHFPSEPVTELTRSRQERTDKPFVFCW